MTEQTAQRVAPTSKFCGRCGARNDRGGSFCGSCGNDLRLPAISQAVPAANPQYGLPARYTIAVLVVGGIIGTLMLGSIFFLIFPSAELNAKGIAMLLAIVVTLGVAVCTYLVKRAFDRNRPELRDRDLKIAGSMFGVMLFLWLALLILTDERTSLGNALLCLPFTAFAIWVLRRIDRNQKEPWRLVVAAFGWGAIVATNLAIPFNTFFMHIVLPAALSGPSLAIASGFVPGVVEEVSKGTAVLLLFLVMRNQFDDVVDGIVYGALVGLGFNFTETQFYMAMSHTPLLQLWDRQIVGLFFGHVAYTALIGAGIGIARQQNVNWKKVVAVLSGFTIAIAAHFTWDAVAFLDIFKFNTLADELFLAPVMTLVVDGPFLVAVLVLLMAGLRREGRALGRELRLESETGSDTILPGELEVLISPHRRAAARLAALRGGGFAGYEKLRQLQEAQLALAMEMWHRERQEIDTPLQAEQELRRRVLMLRTNRVVAGARAS